MDATTFSKVLSLDFASLFSPVMLAKIIIPDFFKDYYWLVYLWRIEAARV